MISRIINFVLIAVVAYWASGAGRYVHERLEHGGHGQTHILDSGDAGVGPKIRASTAVADDHDDHDDCAICQMLAHLSVMRETAAPAATPELLLVSAAVISRQQFSGAYSFDSTPIRGPPRL